MRVVVATHGHCFDGLASAVLFTRLIEHLEAAPQFEYRACGYGEGQQRPTPELLNGDQNAILDYRYSDGERLTWFFDHHRTSFGTAADRADFLARRSTGRFHHDLSYGSCTKLVADVADRQFGFRDPTLKELIHWADVIDSARFENAEQATNLASPILQLSAVVESHANDVFLSRLVPKLCRHSLSEVAAEPWVAERYAPLGQKQEHFSRRVEQAAELIGRVVFVDLTDAVLDSLGKFVTYALFPSSMYSVLVGRLRNGVKISIGYNPWCGTALNRDLSAICARFGGGGHSVVGGISFPIGALEQARHTARQIALELAGGRP